MSTILVCPATINHPPIFDYTAPIDCVACDDTWDEDDDEGDGYQLVNGEAYCTHTTVPGTPSCYEVARNAAYRNEIADATREVLATLLKKLYQIGDRYPGGADDNAGIVEMVEDCRDRTTRFAAGLDCGWNNGAMLSYEETRDLRFALDRVIHHNLVNILARNQMIGTKGYYPSTYDAYSEAKLSATVGRQRLAIAAAESRTENGVAA